MRKEEEYEVRRIKGIRIVTPRQLERKLNFERLSEQKSRNISKELDKVLVDFAL